jgi:hypothetical protein
MKALWRLYEGSIKDVPQELYGGRLYGDRALIEPQQSLNRYGDRALTEPLYRKSYMAEGRLFKG